VVAIRVSLAYKNWRYREAAQYRDSAGARGGQQGSKGLGQVCGLANGLLTDAEAPRSGERPFDPADAGYPQDFAAQMLLQRGCPRH